MRHRARPHRARDSDPNGTDWLPSRSRLGKFRPRHPYPHATQNRPTPGKSRELGRSAISGIGAGMQVRVNREKTTEPNLS